MPETARAEASGARAANAVWFATAVQPGAPMSITAPVFVLTFAIDTASPVEISLDNGVTFVILRDETGATSFAANTNYSRTIPVRDLDQFQVRATNAVTIVYARLDEWH